MITNIEKKLLIALFMFGRFDSVTVGLHHKPTTDEYWQY